MFRVLLFPPEHPSIANKKPWRLHIGHLPRVGDVIRASSKDYWAVAEVVWCLDEGYGEAVRVNIRTKIAEQDEVEPAPVEPCSHDEASVYLDPNKQALMCAKCNGVVITVEDIFAGMHNPQAEMAPWRDYAGDSIFDGNLIRHPSGDVGVVFKMPNQTLAEDKWRVFYQKSKEVNRLCLQIGSIGQAVVLP